MYTYVYHLLLHVYIVTIIKDIVYMYVTCTCIYIHALSDSVYQLLLSKIAVSSVNLAHTCMLP